jgi:hypothetical protein
LPVIAYSVVIPDDGDDDDDEAAQSKESKELDARTKDAVRDVLNDHAYDGKIVIMVWEHKRIANKKHNATQTSLWALLHLDQAPTPPPAKWEGTNYNFFWIVTYGSGNRVKVETSRQRFTGSFADLPDNDWKVPEPVTGDCK